MKKTLALVVALLVCLAPCALAAETITVFNWYDYIDESVIGMFESETGVKVKYANFTTNEEMVTKLYAGASAYDVIFPSDYVIERMIGDEMLLKLDHSKLPNAAGITEWMQKADYDVDMQYSVPYMWGTVGILYNETMVDEPITSWSALFDTTYKRNVFMLASIRDTVGVTLKMLGYPINTREEEALSAVRDALVKQKEDGIVKGYLVDETKDKMISGEAALAVMWSGDALYAMSENEDLKYVVPDEGSNVWVDAMCILNTTAHADAAHAFIDFLCRPDVAAMNTEYIYYSTPVDAVVENMSEEDRANLTLNPTQDIIDRCEFFHDISKFMDVYDKIWMEIRA